MLVSAINTCVLKIMKSKTTTTLIPELKRTLASSAMVVGAAVIALSMPMNAYASSHFEAQLDAIEQEINAYKNQAAQLGDQAATLQAELSRITADKNAIQAQINLYQVKYDQLVLDIAANEVKLSKQKDLLSATLAQLYVNNNQSPIEILAGSESIGDYIDQQEYRSTIRDQVLGAMKEVKAIKEQLGAQKAEVEKVLADQKTQREALAAREADQARLLERTRGEEAAYKQLVGEREAQWQQAQDEMRAFLSAQNSSGSLAPAGRVKAGDIVGYVGNTGLSSGSHLHLEVRGSSGYPVNPGPYIGGWQAPGYVSQGYGESEYFYGPGGHPGIDYAASTGVPIRAVSDGILYRGCSNDVLGTSANQYGYAARVVGNDGTQVIYAHMKAGADGGACDYNTYSGGF